MACAANQGVVVYGREVCRLGSEYIRQLANDKEASAKNSNAAGDVRRHGTRRRSTPQRPCDDVVRDKI